MGNEVSRGFEDFGKGLATGLTFGLVSFEDPPRPPRPPPPNPPPPYVIRLPYPTENPLEEILLENTIDCPTCNLSMKSTASVSTVLLTRELGGLSDAQCNQYDIDKARVDRKELSLFEFASRIHQGLYSRRKEAADGFCREIGMSDYNLQQIAQGEPFTDGMLIYKRNRPVNGSGGFSSESKATLVLSLPVELVFSGVAPYIRTTADLSLPSTTAVARASTAPVAEGFTTTREHFLPLIIAAVSGAFGGGSSSSGGGGGTTIMQAIQDMQVAATDRELAKLGPNDFPFASNTPTQAPYTGTGTIVQKPIRVKSMSLYYPFPMRVNGAHFDAALVFNDPSTGGEKTTVLIPLVVSQTGDEPSSQFIREFARYLPAIRDVDPMSGLYPRATVTTGKDWNVTNLFGFVNPPEGATIPGEPNVKANDRFLVQNGYYVWTAPPSYQPFVQTEFRNVAFAADGGMSAGSFERRVEWHSWQPVDASIENSHLYIMLDSPLSIDSTDFTTLTRTLPATNPVDAIHPIPLSSENYIHHKMGTPPPYTGGTPTNAPPCASDMCKESYVNYNTAVDFQRAKDQFESLQDVLAKNYSTTDFNRFLNNCPGAKCDVFLQNLKQVNMPDHRIVLKIIYSVLFLLAMVVGIYLALAAINRGYHSNVTAVGETFGKLAGITARNWVTGAETPRPAAPAGPGFLDRMASAFRRSKTPTPQ
jgi:hypothetical protein